MAIFEGAPKYKIRLQFFFNWKLKENKDSIFDENFNIRHQFQHFEYDMIRTLDELKRNPKSIKIQGWKVLWGFICAILFALSYP